MPTELADLRLINRNLATDIVLVVWQASCQRHSLERKLAVLRITTRNDLGGIRFIVEGKLAGACVGELEKCWRAAAAAESQEPISVDLTSVSFIDACGKQLLTRMHEKGTRLMASGLMTKSFIEEIESV